MNPDPNSFESGLLIAERFKVISLLGKGGMGEVYLVEEVSSQKRLALKTLLVSSASEKHLKRFELEAKATRLLEHPNLVQIHDYGFIADAQPYFVMDYCEGRTLSEEIVISGPLSIERAIDVFITICNALTYAHTKQVVHRDLKPSNVIISSEQVKVLDFGIAKILTDSPEFNTITQTGELIGSPLYMSPEQCKGRAVDLRSDVYSLGCMLFETLTGVAPFRADNALAIMLKHQSDLPPTLKQASGTAFPKDLEDIVARMLSKEPARRYQDLLRVADDLKHLKRGEPIGSAKSLKKEFTAKKVFCIATGFLILLLGGIFFGNQLQSQLTNTTAFNALRKEEKLPALEKFRHAIPKPTKYFSTINLKTPFVRDFLFPHKSVCDIGYGEDTYKFKPATGLQKSVTIPISVFFKFDSSGLTGFRDDEVNLLILQGYFIDNSTLRAIRNWKNLEVLDLDSDEINATSIDILKGFPKLKSLSVNDTQLTGNDLLQLPLERFQKLGVNQLVDANLVLPRLISSKNLATFFIKEAKVSDEDLRLIGQIKTLTALDIRRSNYTEAGFRHVAELPQLSSLWADGSSLTIECSKTISKIYHLGLLHLDKCQWSQEQKAQFIKDVRRTHPGIHVVFTP